MRLRLEALRLGRQRPIGFILRGINEACIDKGLAAFYASAAGAAVKVSTFVAGPRFAEVDTEVVAESRNGGLILVDEGAQQFHAGIRAFTHRSGHAVHEGLAAVGIDRVVATVRSNDQRPGSPALGDAAGNSEHDAVAKRDDGALHRPLFVMTIRNVTTALEKVGGKQFIHKRQRHCVMPDIQMTTVPSREANFLVIVLRAVIKTQRTQDIVMPLRPVKRGDGIHAAR